MEKESLQENQYTNSGRRSGSFIRGCRKRNEQTERQPDRGTERRIDILTTTDKEIDKQKNRQAHRHTYKLRQQNRRTDRQTI